MARHTRVQKVNRLAMLLWDVAHNQRVAVALQQHGFGQEQVDDGWARLFAVARATVPEPDVVSETEPNGSPKPGSTQPPVVNVLQELDRFENHWYPIVYATLEAFSPPLRQRVFWGLRQTSGVALLATLPVLLNRLDALESSDVASEREAFLRIRNRGLTADKVAWARGLVRLAQTFEPIPPDFYEMEIQTEQEQEQQHQAEQYLWDYVLEWTTVIRAAGASEKRVGRPRKKRA